MNRIIEDINSGNLASAKEEIEKLETRLGQEASSRNREKLKAEIANLKKMYSAKLEIAIPSTVETRPAPLGIDIKFIFNSTDEKYIIERATNHHIPSICYKHVDISECTEIETELIECEETIFLKSVSKSRIHVKTKYLRLVGCSDLYMKVDSALGIYLQNSSNITFKLPSGSRIQIFDFDCPVKSQNYRVIMS